MILTGEDLVIFLCYLCKHTLNYYTYMAAHTIRPYTCFLYSLCIYYSYIVCKAFWLRRIDSEVPSDDSHCENHTHEHGHGMYRFCFPNPLPPMPPDLVCVFTVYFLFLMRSYNGKKGHALIK